MKYKSPRSCYEAQHYAEETPWGDLSEHARKYWEEFYNRCRETARKEILDDLND